LINSLINQLIFGLFKTLFRYLPWCNSNRWSVKASEVDCTSQSVISTSLLSRSSLWHYHAAQWISQFISYVSGCIRQM